VIIGLKEGGNSWKKAEADGHKVMSIAEATKQGDIIHVLIPDMIQAQVYKDKMKKSFDSKLSQKMVQAFRELNL